MRKINLLCLALIGLVFTACHSNDDTWGDWSKAAEFGGSNRVCAVSFTASNGDVYVGMGFNSTLSAADQNMRDFWKFNGSGWSRVGQLEGDVHTGDFPDLGRTGSVAFVIDDKAYVGAGWRRGYTSNKDDEYFSDFYIFDIKTQRWEKEADGVTYKKIDITSGGFDKADCAFYSGVGFSQGGKGYVGTGQVKDRVIQTIFCYDPSTNTWTNSNFGGDSRVGAVTFTINDQTVVCLGGSGSTNVRDVWVLKDGKWSSRAPLADLDGSWNDDYGQIPRSFAVAFTSSLDSKNGVPKGYIAGGGNGNTCWEYNIETDRWDEVSKFPSAMNSIRVGAIGFTHNNYGYITTGGTTTSNATDNSTWKFYPGLDEDDNNDY